MCVCLSVWGVWAEVVFPTGIMKGTKVQTLGVRAVAGVCMVHGWCMAGCLGHKNYGHGCNY